MAIFCHLIFFKSSEKMQLTFDQMSRVKCWLNVKLWPWDVLLLIGLFTKLEWGNTLAKLYLLQTLFLSGKIPTFVEALEKLC